MKLQIRNKIYTIKKIEKYEYKNCQRKYVKLAGVRGGEYSAVFYENDTFVLMNKSCINILESSLDEIKFI